MIAISSVIGNIFQDKELADKFEKLKKTMSCEVLKFSRSELDKTRFRKQTDKGTDIGCILDSEHRLQNGDVMYSNTEKIIIIEQIPEKVISVKIKKIKANSEEILVKLGHIIGNRHRPIQIDENGKILFPILSDSELDTFKKLFSEIIEHIEMKIEEK
ncbi:MAG TPA: Urease accessory protein, partial [Nitrosopumilaceae archaeon]|nr:Urease accessory protein [Nitrosopumilaceae archaeon]